MAAKDKIRQLMQEQMGPPESLAGSQGMLEPGNIDLYNRPDVEGSTVRSMSFNEDGREILIPTVVGNKIVSDEDAIAEYERSGQHMGVFESPEAATSYAEAVHKDYESGRIPTGAKDNVWKLIQQKLQAIADSPDIVQRGGKRGDVEQRRTLLRRQLMNAFPTLFGMGVGAYRGATFGPGPEGSIMAQFPDETKSIDPQTLGEVMILPEHQSGPTIQQHELGHVAQGRYLGPLLPAAAGATAGALQLSGRDPYLESPFETSAMEMGRLEGEGAPLDPAAGEALRQLFSKKP